MPERIVRLLAGAVLLSSLAAGMITTAKPFFRDTGCKTVSDVCQQSGLGCLSPSICSDNTAGNVCTCITP
jgi:hypothetical protein